MKRAATRRETRWRDEARSHSGLWLLAAAVVATGCRESGSTAGDVAVRDSAGVRIVEVAATDGAPRWSVGEPSLVLGADDIGGFGMIAGAIGLDDGLVAVADAFAGQVRFFDAEGRPVARAGRRGEGPGEFEAIQAIWRTPGDSVGVWDGRFGRYTLLAADGGIGPSIPLEATAERARHTPVGPLPGGRLLARSDARAVPGLEYYRADLALLAFGPGGEIADTLARVPGVEMWDWIVERGTVPSAIPFGAETWIDVEGDAVYVGTNEGYAFDRYDAAGRLLVRFRMMRAPIPLGTAAIEAYKREERDKANSSMASKGGNDIFGAMAEDAPYPEHYPFYAGLLVDETGNVWVRDYPTDPAAPTRLTVFGPEGSVIGTADLPAELRPTEIRNGRVIGVWRDDLDLEHVRVYELRDGG